MPVGGNRIKKLILGTKKFVSSSNFLQFGLFNRELYYKSGESGGLESKELHQRQLFGEVFGQDGLDGAGFPYYNLPGSWTYDALDISFYGNNDIIPFCDVPGSYTLNGVFMLFSNTSGYLDNVYTYSISKGNYKDLTLEWNEYKNVGAPDINIYWSTDAITWNPITYTPPTADSTWRAVITTLDAAVNSVSSLYLKFEQQSDLSGNLIAIDDIKLKGYV